MCSRPGLTRRQEFAALTLSCTPTTHAYHPRLHPPLFAPVCRRPGDDAYGPNQKLNVMLQRILVADYVFPDSKQLRWGSARHLALPESEQLRWGAALLRIGPRPLLGPAAHPPVAGRSA